MTELRANYKENKQLVPAAEEGSCVDDVKNINFGRAVSQFDAEKCDYKCIKEIVIDKGHRIEVFPRKQLLKDDEILLFHCPDKSVVHNKLLLHYCI
ncbi:hypothetical protein INT47_007283 [Mucor saturninus]|uniref:Uncharacterized protein n=1 Tax=Mucor saturninus TaxID=64648 RepID=A0A8H7V3X3_9FUNG|nr:hypothetical protein INT47_007283 [Mucor saturninus]